MHRKFKKLLKQLFCEHEFTVLYLDYRVRMDQGTPVRDWVCGCRKCEKRIRVESRGGVL